MAAGWGDLNAMVSRRGALGETRPTSRAAALRGEEFSFGGGSLKIVSQRPGRPRTGVGGAIATNRVSFFAGRAMLGAPGRAGPMDD